jgi:hypothetical protein
VNLADEEQPDGRPDLAPDVLQGGVGTYAACQAESRRLRSKGRTGLIAPSAALLPGGATGWRVERGALQAGPLREGLVMVLFGAQPHLVGWLACARGRPGPSLLARVRQLPRP